MNITIDWVQILENSWSGIITKQSDCKRIQFLKCAHVEENDEVGNRNRKESLGIGDGRTPLKISSYKNVVSKPSKWTFSKSQIIRK